MKKQLFIIIGIGILLCLYCQKDQKSDTELAPTVRIPAVCIWDGAGLRAEPNQNGKWLSSLCLGETMTWLGPAKIDTSSKKPIEYIMVELSDSTIGWASSYLIVTNATLGALKVDSPVYKRPDAVTKTNDTFSMMDMVAVTQEQDDWVQVIGEKRKKKGWIRKAVITTSKPDVTFAILANKEFQKEDGRSRREKIQAILENTPYKDSYFARQIDRIH